MKNVYFHDAPFLVQNGNKKPLIYERPLFVFGSFRRKSSPGHKHSLPNLEAVYFCRTF